jgi:hypothetical protein
LEFIVFRDWQAKQLLTTCIASNKIRYRTSLVVDEKLWKEEDIYLSMFDISSRVHQSVLGISAVDHLLR